MYMKQCVLQYATPDSLGVALSMACTGTSRWCYILLFCILGGKSKGNCSCCS